METIGANMEITRVVVGELQENCYIVKQNNSCLIIDPGSEFDQIQKNIGNFQVEGVCVTHHHFDHVGALKQVLETYPVKLYDDMNCEEKEYTVGPFTFQVIKNPGHTTDSVSFYFPHEKVMFVGDFIFFQSIGRCDLEGGNFETMKKSIEKIKKYQDDITLYPGHGIKTTLQEEKKNNPYF